MPSENPSSSDCARQAQSQHSEAECQEEQNVDPEPQSISLQICINYREKSSYFMGENAGRPHFNHVTKVNRFISTVVTHIEKVPSGPQNSSPQFMTVVESGNMLGKSK